MTTRHLSFLLFVLATISTLTVILASTLRFYIRSRSVMTTRHISFLLFVLATISTLTVILASTLRFYIRSRSALSLDATFFGSVRIADTLIKQTTSSRACPDVLTGVASGRWITRPLTSDESAMINSYLIAERGAHRIPPNFQRADGRCGTVAYENTQQHKHMWFKAICDPRGPTPCCHTDRCVPLSMDECRCPTCYDERQAIHAEFSKWQPDDVRCLVKTFSSQEACRLLNGSTLYFVGDSFIRHVFVAMVILLSSNTVDGEQNPKWDSSMKALCPDKMASDIQCRNRLLNESISLCDTTVKVKYIQVLRSQDLQLIQPALSYLRNSNKSIMIMGLGIHDDFNFNVVKNKFLLPFLNMRHYLSTSLDRDLNLDDVIINFRNLSSQSWADNPSVKHSVNNLEYLIFRGPEAVVNTSQSNVVFERFPREGVDVEKLWPRLLWIGAHAPGLLKSPKFQRQTADGVQEFNTRVQRVLQRWRVPYLDTFSLTKGTVSFDGTHYGWGINMMKVNMILTYMEAELVPGWD